LNRRIYLDYAATTPARPEVVTAMLPFFSEVGFNASSVHSEGRAARAALDNARDRVARILGSARKEIIFTSSGSEADSLALIGAARGLRARGRHIVSTVFEHHAVLFALDALRDEGFEVTLLPVDARGLVDVEAFSAALRPDTILASVMYANNEIGTVQPLAQLAVIARERGVVMHTDAVQAAGYLSLDVRRLGVDMLSLSAHKFYGPKGVGVLFVRDGVPLQPLVFGGTQEFGKRAGTENVAGAVGFATALELATAELETVGSTVARLRDRLESILRERIPGLRVNGAEAPRLPNNLSLAIPGVEAEQLLVRLDLEGVAVSSGSACTSGAIEPSHVIAALGLPADSWGALRLTLGRSTTQEEVERVGDILPRIVSDLRNSQAPA
jgi:cysteine desulfurase